MVYAYLHTICPDGQPISGWSETPVANFRTPQPCDSRDHFATLNESAEDRVFGQSTPTAAYQRDVVDRLDISFALLADAALAFWRSFGLPLFVAGGMTLLHRRTMVVGDRMINRPFHPISGPTANAAEVLES